MAAKAGSPLTTAWTRRDLALAAADFHGQALVMARQKREAGLRARCPAYPRLHQNV